MTVAVVVVVVAALALVVLLGGGVALARIRRVSAQNRLLSAIIDSSSSALMSLDREGRVTSWNHGAERMFGYLREEILGMAYDVIVPPEDLASHHEDITAERRAAKTLRETQQRLQAVLDNSPNLIYLKDPEGRFVMVNRQLAQHMERSENEVVGKTVFEIYPPETAEEFAKDDRLVIATGAPVEREIKVTFPAGARVVISNKFPLVDPDGNVQLICGISTDVTERKQAEDDLRELQWQLHGMMENAFTSMYLKDLEGHYLLVNSQLEELLAHPSSEILGRTAFDFLPTETAARLTARDREVLASGPSVTQEVTLPLPSGDRVVLSNKFPLRGRDGTVRYLGGIALDITDRKRMESALSSATAAAEAANGAKSDFLSRMSHELRTPLNVILGFGQLLQLDDLRPDQAEALEHILDAGTHLLDLINDALDISRVESGRVSLSLEPVELTAFCRETIQLLRPLADSSNIRVEGPASEARELWVTADRQRLKQILLNLVSNAIKYNHRDGTVTVTCTFTDHGISRCAVADTGPGIPPEKLDRMFTPFDRLGAEGSGIEGTGLGLALTKRLVEAMGGAIGFENGARGGATFWIDLLPATPRGSTENEGESSGVPSPAGPSEPKVIVYIEDSLANVELMESLLARWPNVRLIPAMQGRMGLDLARQHRPNLVILDLNLPDVSGEDVLRELKSDAATSSIPVVIVSADANPQQVDRLKAAGAVAYFTKPFNVPELLDTLARELGTVTGTVLTRRDGGPASLVNDS